MNIPNEKYLKIKYSKSLLNTVMIFFILFIIFLGSVYIRTRSIDWIVVTVVFGVFSVILIYYILGYSITLANGVFIYKTRLDTKRINIDEIESVWIENGIVEFKNIFQPPLRLMIKTKAKNIFFIHLRVFKYRDIKQLLQIFGCSL